MLQQKDISWLNVYKNKTCIYAVCKRPISDQGQKQTESEGWKNVFNENGNQIKLE